MSKESLSLPKRVKQVTAIGLASAAAFGLSGCGAATDNVKPGDIICSGEQNVLVENGDTYNGMIVDHVNNKDTITSNEDYARLFAGIAFHQTHKDKDGLTFVITGREVGAVGPSVTAGNYLPLPEFCVQVPEK